MRSFNIEMGMHEAGLNLRLCLLKLQVPWMCGSLDHMTVMCAGPDQFSLLYLFTQWRIVLAADCHDILFYIPYNLVYLITLYITVQYTL